MFKMAGVTSGQFDDCDDTPREVDLLTEEHVEDLLDAVECLRGKVEQLQIHCEKLIYEKGVVEEQLIEREKEFVEKESYYEKELASLRKLNVKLLARAESSQESSKIPTWVKSSLDAETAIEEKNKAKGEVKSLEIQLREKDKQLSNLEWQVMDAEATITSIQAERDHLAVELDGMLAREEEKLEAYRYSSDDRTVYSDDEYEGSKLNASRKKNTRRHLSDLTRRDDSQIEDFTDFVRNRNNMPSLSNNDVPSAADNEFHGGLKRTTNFNNINNVDEFTDFHQDEDVERNIDLSASYPSAKIKSLPTCMNWHSFGSDSDSGLSPAKVNQSTSWVLSDLPSSELQNEGSFEEGCFEDAGDWALEVEPATLESLVGCKNGSCRSSSSAYFSDNSTGQDPWLFTPDSIIDVSTGEELKVTPAGSKTSLGSDNDIQNQQTKLDVSKQEDTKSSSNKQYSSNQKLISTKEIKMNPEIKQNEKIPSDEKENCNSDTKLSHNQKNGKTELLSISNCYQPGKVGSASQKNESGKNLNITAEVKTGSQISTTESESLPSKNKSSNVMVKNQVETNFVNQKPKNNSYTTACMVTVKQEGSLLNSDLSKTNIKDSQEKYTKRNQISATAITEIKSLQTEQRNINSQTLGKTSVLAENATCEKAHSLNHESSSSRSDSSKTEPSSLSVNGNSSDLLNTKSRQIVGDKYDKDTTQPATLSTVNGQHQRGYEVSKLVSQNGGLLCSDLPCDSCDNFERTASVRSDSAMVTSNREPVNHQRINSEPAPQSPLQKTCETDSKGDGFVKLQAYQKWRMSGKKGQPPAKLKISQC